MMRERKINMTRIYINKKYYDKLLYRRYARYITGEKITKKRVLLMLQVGVNYSVRSLYNFINNTYLLELLGNIIVYKKYKNNL